MPRCTRCEAEKPLADFHRDRSASYGRKPHCKECAKQLNAEQWCKHREKRAATKRKYRVERGPQISARHRAYKIERQYGLTKEQVDAMRESQNGKCAICSDALVQAKKGGLAIDHCHATGKVRGLLCHRCNTGLGLFRDRPELLIRAAEYVGGNGIVPQVAAEVLGALMDVSA